MGSNIPGTCYPGKKRPLPGMPRLLTEWVFTRIPKYQDPRIPQISNFQIHIFAILDAKQSKVTSQIVVFGAVLELIVKKKSLKINEFQCIFMCWPRVTLFG